MADQFDRSSEFHFPSVIRTSFDMERERLERQKPSNLMMLTEEMRSIDGKFAFPFGGGGPAGMKPDYGEGIFGGRITRDEWTAKAERWVDAIAIKVEEMESEVGLRVVRSRIQKLAYQATIFPMVLMLERLKDDNLKWPVDDQVFFGATTRGDGFKNRHGTRAALTTTKPKLDEIANLFEQVCTDMEKNIVPGTGGGRVNNNYARNKPTLVVCGTAMRWQFGRLFNYDGDPNAPEQTETPTGEVGGIGVDTGYNPYTMDRVMVVSVPELTFEHYYFDISMMERPYYHLIWNYPAGAGGDVRRRVDQTKLASDEAYMLVTRRRSQIVAANPHLAYQVFPA